MIDATFIKEIVSQAIKGIEINHRGQKYVLDNEGFPRPIPSAKIDVVEYASIAISSLTGFIDYIKSPFCPVGPDKAHILLEREGTVLATNRNVNKTIESVCTVANRDILPPQISSNNLDDFFICIRQKFLPNADLTRLLNALSKIVNINSETYTDTGSSIQVDVKEGVSVLGTDKLDNRYSLFPNWVHPELAESASFGQDWFLRIQKTKDGCVYSLVAFNSHKFELDYLEATKRYLRERLDGWTIV